MEVKIVKPCQKAATWIVLAQKIKLAIFFQGTFHRTINLT